MECIFCSIVKKDISSEIIYEDDSFLVFNDIKPKADFHVLIVPKQHIVSLIEDSRNLAGEMVVLAKKIAEDNSLKGYKLIMNVGKKGGQEVDHMHLHVLASKV